MVEVVGRPLADRRAVTDVELPVVRELGVEREPEQAALVVAAELRRPEVDEFLAHVEEGIVAEAPLVVDVDLSGLVEDEPPVLVLGSDLESGRMSQSLRDQLQLDG